MKGIVKFSRNFGGGGVMIWAGFCAAGKTEIAYVPTKINSQNYIELLEDTMVERTEELCGVNFVFQQDNAAVHSAKIVEEWFSLKNIEVLDWPARSPDLNPIENLWGVLSRLVYTNGRQYNTVGELKEAIKLSWNSISNTTLQNLMNTMPNRVFETITRKGGSTHY